MGGQVSTVEQALGRIGSAAHGVVTRVELLRTGVTRREIERRVENGTLIREYRGVYRVGHRAPSVEARYMAAVKACGESAVLSGPAAAWALGLVKGRAPAPEVTAPTERRLPGVRTHRGRDVETMTWRGIAVTTPGQTLVDIAGETPEYQLAKACHDAGVRYRTTPRQVEGVLARRPNAPGAAKLRRIIRGETKIAISRLEQRFLKLLRKERLPLPITNRPAGGRRVDCRWREHKLTVELDSYRFHNSRHAWEQDRRRERQAYARGDQFRRYTWGDVLEEPAPMLAELKQLLPCQTPAGASKGSRAARPAHARRL